MPLVRPHYHNTQYPTTYPANREIMDEDLPFFVICNALCVSCNETDKIESMQCCIACARFMHKACGKGTFGGKVANFGVSLGFGNIGASNTNDHGTTLIIQMLWSTMPAELADPVLRQLSQSRLKSSQVWKCATTRSDDIQNDLEEVAVQAMDVNGRTLCRS